MDSALVVAILGLIGIIITVICSVVNIYLAYFANMGLEKNIRRRPLHIKISFYTREELYHNSDTNTKILSNHLSKNLISNQKYLFIKIINESEYYFTDAVAYVNNQTYNIGFMAPKIEKIIPLEIISNLNIQINYNNEFNEKFTQEIQYLYDEKKIVKNRVYLRKKFKKVLISSTSNSAPFMTMEQFNEHFLKKD